MNDISSDYMELLQPNIKNSWIDKTAAAQSVRDIIQSLRPDSQSSITITRGKSGDWPVCTVIEELSGGTEIRVSSDVWPITLIEELVGTYLNRSSGEYVEKRKSNYDS